MVVFTNGCFDILHAGHIEYLEKSRVLGDQLFVGINSDESVKRLKGPSRPINNQEDRKRMLEALKCVDKVYIFDEDCPFELIKKIKPDILTKGGDYANKILSGSSLVSRVVIIPFKEGYSTTNLVNKIKNEN